MTPHWIGWIIRESNRSMPRSHRWCIAANAHSRNGSSDPNVLVGTSRLGSRVERPHLDRATPATLPRNITFATITNWEGKTASRPRHAGDSPTEYHTRASSLGKLSAGFCQPCGRAGSCRLGHPGQNNHYDSRQRRCGRGWQGTFLPVQQSGTPGWAQRQKGGLEGLASARPAQ